MARFHRRRKGRASIKGEPKRKASVIGRVGMMFLSCGTGAWRVRSSMNTMSECMGLTCTADIGLMSINYTCFDGEACFSQSLCLTNTGVNNSKLTRLEIFINDFVSRCDSLTCEQVHNELDDIERYTDFTRRLFWALRRHLPAERSHSCLAVD